MTLMISLYFYLCFFISYGLCFKLTFTQKLPSLSAEVQRLVEVLNSPQSLKSRKQVESLISVLSEKANKNPTMYRKQIKQGNAYRTLWSTVTSSSLVGQLLRQKPSVVLNGPSWQTISSDGKTSENIVQWRVGDFSIRMVGLASLTPLKSEIGYGLVIRGLEFRVAKANKTVDCTGKKFER